jgi:hypothetical protein
LQPRTHSLKLSKQTNKQTLHTQVCNKNQNPKTLLPSHPYYYNNIIIITSYKTFHIITQTRREKPLLKTHSPQEFPNTSKSIRERERERERACKNLDG